MPAPLRTTLPSFRSRIADTVRSIGRRTTQYLALAGLLALPVLLATACDDLFGPDVDRRLGVIYYGEPWPVHIEVPDSALVGEGFEITVLTYGNGSCMSQGSTDVRVDGSSVDVTPYDIHGGGRVCRDVLLFFYHRASVTIPTEGTSDIRVHGRHDPTDSVMVVVRQVVVTPVD